MKKAIIAVSIVVASFFHGFASADDFTSQVQATQSVTNTESVGQGATLSEAFGKLKSFGTSVASGITSKVASVAGLSPSKTAAPVEEAQFKNLASASQVDSISQNSATYPAFNNTSTTSKQVKTSADATAYSRTRCTTTVKSKGVEEKVCETTYLSSNEGGKYFQ